MGRRWITYKCRTVQKLDSCGLEIVVIQHSAKPPTCPYRSYVCRRELKLVEEQIDKLEQEMANLLSAYQDVVQRLAEVPGLGVDSAQQIIAEVGPAAAAFPSPKYLVS